MKIIIFIVEWVYALRGHLPIIKVQEQEIDVLSIE